jgi:hypothetical protein
MISPTRPSLQLVISATAILAIAGCGGSASTGNILHPAILNTLRLSSEFQGSGISVQGSLAYVSMAAIGSQSAARSLVIVSLQTPIAPTILSSTSAGLTSDMAGIAVSGDFAYVPFESVSGANFQVWDVSNPQRPSIVGSTSISCPVGMFPFGNPAVYGSYVYVSCFASEMTVTGSFAIVDVTNPAAPVLARSVPVTSTYQPIAFAVEGQDLNVVATQGGSTSDYLLLYSIANPASPVLLATEQVPHSPQWVAADGTVALVPIYDSVELETVDFANPSSPQVSTVNLGSCHPTRVAVYQGDLALVACDAPGGVAEVNLTTAGHTSFAGSAMSGTVFTSLTASASYVYGVDAEGNFETVGF